MATVGVDCQVILDGHGYWVEPHSSVLDWPRIRRAVVLLDGSLRCTDLGPGKRAWHLTLLCLNQLRDYTGAALAATGQAMRAQLIASYWQANAALADMDLDGAAYSVRFDNLTLQVRDPSTQLQRTGYHAAVTLLEA